MKRTVSVILMMLLLVMPACGGSDPGYTDVPDGAWYGEAAAALWEKGVMEGVGGGLFDPDGVFTRAQLVTVLYRLAGEPAVEGEDGFADTQPGAWYADAVLWAFQKGIVNGYGNGSFGTDDPTTQEQLAVMLWRSAGSYVLGDEYAHPDGAENAAADWAFDGVRWARVDGLLTDAVPFEPALPAARAQAADMVYRYLQLLERFSDADAVSGATPQADRGGEEKAADGTGGLDPAGKEGKMKLKLGETEVPVTWEDNPSVAALRQLLPLTIRMSMYGGFEQVGPIGQSIERNDAQITAGCGDIVLYAGDQIVVFYGSNSWAYTRLGHVDLDSREITALLSGGGIDITLSEG